MKNYIFASNKNWHIDYFMHNRKKLPGNWSIVTCSEDLADQVANISPRFIFFPHWSQMVEQQIHTTVECVCFHMTDLPFGRGGSPLQNLISRGVKQTMISALRMTETLDGGPVYSKRNLRLEGSASDIYKSTAPICFEMMKSIVRDEPNPIEQVGEVVVFKRRKEKDSDLVDVKTVQEFYDHVRMLDAPGYPAAYLVHNGMKIKFNDVELDSSNHLVAKVRVTTDE